MRDISLIFEQKFLHRKNNFNISTVHSILGNVFSRKVAEMFQRIEWTIKIILLSVKQKDGLTLVFEFCLVCFQGKVPYKVLQIHSTFEEQLNVTRVAFEPPDSRFYFESASQEPIILEPEKNNIVSSTFVSDDLSPSGWQHSFVQLILK